MPALHKSPISFLRSFARLSLLALAAIAPLAHAGGVTWIGPDHGLWDNAANWSPAVLPSAADTAVFGANPNSDTSIQLDSPLYPLTGLTFLDSGYALTSPGVPGIALSGGTLSSYSEQSAANVIRASVAMLALDNTINVSGPGNYELELADLAVSGSLTANVTASLCLTGSTSISGALVKTGTGQLCTEGGITAASTTVLGGQLLLEHQSTLGNTTVIGGGSVVVSGGATISANSFYTAGAVALGLFANGGETLVSDEGVFIMTGGGLTGFGTIRGNVTVLGGGQIAPYGLYDISHLTIEGDVDFQVNSIASFVIAAPGIVVGSLDIDGSLTLHGLLSLNNCADEGLFTLINFTGDLNGGFAGLQDTVDGYDYEILYNPHSIQLSVTAIPEPATCVLIALALTFLLFRSPKSLRKR